MSAIDNLKLVYGSLVSDSPNEDGIMSRWHDLYLFGGSRS